MLEGCCVEWEGPLYLIMIFLAIYYVFQLYIYIFVVSKLYPVI